MKNKNYIRHVPYLRNSVAYDHDFWYTWVKWWYLQAFFSFFSTFWFFGLLGRGWGGVGVGEVARGKRAKNDPKWQKILLVAVHISGAVHMIVIYVVYVSNKNISSCFFQIFKILIFWVVRRVKGKKLPKMTKNSVFQNFDFLGF